VRWLTTEHLLAEQARYQEMLADGVDPEQRRVAEARLRKIVEELERRETRVPAQHRGNRWPHVPILELFREFGAVLREKPDRTCVGDHPWRHGSKSGTCLIIWPDEGRLLCRSCMASGDAAALVADWRGCSYSDACRRLEARFGPAPVDYEKLPWIKASTQDLRVISAQAWEALRRANDQDPFIFQFGGSLISPGSGKLALPCGSGTMVVPGGRGPSPAWRERGVEAGVRGTRSRLSPGLEAVALVDTREV